MELSIPPGVVALQKISSTGIVFLEGGVEFFYFLNS